MNAVNNKGFSLLELLVAIAIIAIAGTTLFNGFVMSGRIHMNTTQLQMAEDVAQEVAEDFNAQYVDVLKTQLSTATGITITDTDPNGNNLTRTVDFLNIPYTYDVRPGADGSSFLVDVKLESKKTAGVAETARDTTYKQSSKEATSFYAVDSTVGTNTFIIPEVTNIYDGESTVVSQEINQHDNVVISDLWTVIKQKIDEKNVLLLGTNQIDVNIAEGSYNSLYMPLTNITGDDMLKKTTEITVKGISQLGGEIKYYYVVTCEYEFKFDFPIVNKKGIAVSVLSDFVDNGDLAAITSASAYASSYTVVKSGDTYTVRYEKDLAEVDSDLAGTKGSFGGPIIAPNEPGRIFLEDNPDPNSGVKVPYVYFVYVPFDLYSDPTGGECNDEIEFKYDGPIGANRNIIRAFLVEQKVEMPTDPTVTSKIKECKINSIGYDSSVFKLYTNSEEIIEDTGNLIDGKNYLTNSYGKKRYNLYDMTITVKDLNGNTVATYNTVKEE